MPCLAHTLQLSLKDAMKHSEPVLNRARRLVHLVRKSSVANEKMIDKCGKTLIRDCVTRWNSTLDMMKRLLDTKIPLSDVLEEQGIDTLLTSDWSKLENLVKVMEPFAIHTDQLQTDSQSLSDVVPCLLNLEAHLQATTIGKQSAQVLLKSLKERFACILNPQSAQFDPTPAGACLMDPTVALALMTSEMEPLMKVAESFVVQLAMQYSSCVSQASGSSSRRSTEGASPAATPATVLHKYRFLASKIEAEKVTTRTGCEPGRAERVQCEMKKYIEEVKQGLFTESPLKFWQERKAVYPKLAPTAEDLVAAPASQAFVERIFSVCGQLSSGLRNRMDSSLEHRVFLKINQKVLLD